VTRETDDERPDLGAMVMRFGRALIAMEEPILSTHDVSMWGYIVLSALRSEPTRTQAALARAIGADKTRLIAVLDTLQGRGLIARAPDPADRRVHLLDLTDAGRAKHAAIQADIRSAEERLLAALPEGDRAAFIRGLRALSPDRRGAD
jgi:DNA-binding MarR family transcriptional regulator